MNRIKGPLGDSSWKLSTAPQEAGLCIQCGKPVAAGTACFARGVNVRHPGCQLQARHASMSSAEQEELWLRLNDLLADAEEDPS